MIYPGFSGTRKMLYRSIEPKFELDPSQEENILTQ